MGSVAWLGSGLSVMLSVARRCGGDIGSIDEVDATAVANRRYYVCESLAVLLFSLELTYALHKHPERDIQPLRGLKVGTTIAYALFCAILPVVTSEESLPDAAMLPVLACGLIALVVFSFVETRYWYG